MSKLVQSFWNRKAFFAKGNFKKFKFIFFQRIVISPPQTAYTLNLKPIT